MKPTPKKTIGIAYKWLSICFILAAAYYWFFTLGLIFFGYKFSQANPQQTFVYRTFLRQNWRLFAITKTYNRQMNFIVREKANPQHSDTTDLVQYLLANKRAYAPFNNYSDALDRILYDEMNNLERLIIQHKKKLQDSLPGQSPAFYQSLAGNQLQADSLHQQALHNIAAFGRYILLQQNKPVGNREYQLQIIHTYIPAPGHQQAEANVDSNKLVFVSSYKTL